MSYPARRAVLFDLDGTLVDTAPDLAGSLNELRAARGLAPLRLDELRPLCSFGGRGMLGKGLKLAPDHADYARVYAEFVAIYAKRMTRDTRVFDGMRELLRDLAAAGLVWGVVTNKIESLAAPLIAHMAFDPAPGCVIGGDSAGVAKPDPAPLFLACERLGADPADSIYIGDSERDVAAGHAAGMATIGVGYGYIAPGDNVRDWRAGRVVDTVDQLFDAVTQSERY